jgi:glycerol-3-phosphate dehydrogenase
MLFSVKNRGDALQTIEEDIYDVLIIGGGITGAGIALDAATRGLNTILFEMQDFAEGTSSRSTKLIHGGLRYLKQFEVKLVAEVGKERDIVYENGPHVTKPEWMLLPIYINGTFGKFSTSIGLKVYDFLAGVKKNERRTMLSAEETMVKEPLLKKEGLLGGGYYVEYRTDDARLTIEVMKKAAEHGAKAFNYMKVNSLLYDNGKVIGVTVKDVLNDKEYKIFANKIINATGPWVDTLRELDGSKKGKRLRLSKGVHIVIGQDKFPLKQAVYYDTPDGRMVFAIPRDGKTYVGTTDTFYEDEIASPRMTEDDLNYLINTIEFMFPDIKLAQNDIESSWAGVRPLIYEEGKNPSEISRKDEIWQSSSGLITIAGGKLTGYRKMAELTMDLVANLFAQEGKVIKDGKTKHLPISGGDVGGSSSYKDFIKRVSSDLVSLGISQNSAEKLVHLYGSNIEHVVPYIKSFREVSTDLPAELAASVQYAIEHEMVVKPADYFIRRTGALFFAIDWVQKWKEPVISFMAQQLNWPDELKRQYTKQLDDAIKHVHPI